MPLTVLTYDWTEGGGDRHDDGSDEDGCDDDAPTMEYIG